MFKNCTLAVYLRLTTICISILIMHYSIENNQYRLHTYRYVGTSYFSNLKKKNQKTIGNFKNIRNLLTLNPLKN